MELANKFMQIEIAESCGQMKALRAATDDGFATWNGSPGHLIIDDGLRGRSYSIMDDAAATTVRRSRSRIEITRRFKDADFLIHEIYRLRGDELSWTLQVTLKAGKKRRSIEIRQLVPYPTPAYGVRLWTGRAGFPSTLERLGGLDLSYGELCYGTVFPSLTFFRESDDAGLTVCKPFDFRTSQLSFAFQDYRSNGVYLYTRNLALHSDQPATTRFIFHFHEGCWRAGLGWLYNKYPDYFNPPNPKVREIEGGYLLGHPFMTDAELDSMAPYGLKWEELHCQFPDYGNYLPQEQQQWFPTDSWEDCVAFDQAGGVALTENKNKKIGKSTFSNTKPISYSLLKKHIRHVQAHGAKSLYYWQSAGDASESIQNRFSDSLARNEHGDPYPSVPGSNLMNADPSTSFGKHISQATDRLFKVLPEIDGVFLDQLCYSAIDYAHDDGITMANNKPACNLWHCYEKPVKQLTDAVHRRGKVVFGNGPYNVEVQKDIDGLMAEGASWLAETIKYLCITKPLLFLSFYHDDAHKAEHMFQSCLLSGASYSLFPHPPKAVIDVINVYRPLVDKLQGRRWLLEPNPLTLPEGINGNIFIGEDGDILISLISAQGSCLADKGVIRNVKLSARFKSTSEIRTAQSLGTHYHGTRKVRMTRRRSELTLVICEHCAATLVVLKK